MSTKQNGWIGVDLDGTLARYDEWRGVSHIGEPIELMVKRVKHWLAAGVEVRVFTARAFPDLLIEPSQILKPDHPVAYIRAWCEKHLGQVLTVTCVKDYNMLQLWDDRAVQVIPNTGVRADNLL